MTDGWTQRWTDRIAVSVENQGFLKDFFRNAQPLQACPCGAVGSVAVRAVWLQRSANLGSRPGLAESLCQVIAAYDLILNSRAGTQGSTVFS